MTCNVLLAGAQPTLGGGRPLTADPCSFPVSLLSSGVTF